MTLPEISARLVEIERKLDLLVQFLVPLPQIDMNDLAESRAKTALQADLFSRREAAFYTRRSEKHFDNTLRHQLNNYGSERRPLYSKKEIDECLNLQAPKSADTNVAPTTTSAFRTMGSVTTSQRARLFMRKLKDSRNDSTGKS